MRIGVDVRRLAGQRFGIGRYLEYLLNHWVGLARPGEHFSLLHREPVNQQGLKLSGEFQLEQLGPSLTEVLWENFVLGRRVKGLDVLFCPSYTAPLWYDGRFVVATHSVNEAQEGAHSWMYKLTYSQWYRLSAGRADCVIVPSNSTREDVHRHYGIPREKIEIVPEGADRSFRRIEDEDVLRHIRTQYFGDERPYVLFVGKFSQRRNIPTLMAAFAAVKKRYGLPHGLLLVGHNVHGLPLEQHAHDLGITDSFVQTLGEFESHEEIIPIYSAADLYVYPSLYDGFSLTVVEAMACGLPVVSVNSGAVAEIAEGYAELVDEVEVDSLAAAMGRVLTDRARWEELRAKSLDRAQAFRWEDTARSTLEIVRDVAAR